MSLRNICIYPNHVLKEPTEAITNFDDALRDIVTDMWDSMYYYDGIGLAAPQIGLSKKIAVIDYKGEKYTLINPVITEKNGERFEEEGCLSFPGIYAKVSSPSSIKVKYQDETGTIIEKEIDGFLACAFSHEIDHLNGVLLIDRVSNLKKQFIKKKLIKQKSREEN
ncbi:MAG: peptide deformylase [Synergistaceae bacterium]